ncbi:MAG: hypothetical protein ABFD59_08220 [Smithella sp.]
MSKETDPKFCAFCDYRIRNHGGRAWFIYAEHIRKNHPEEFRKIIQDSIRKKL